MGVTATAPRLELVWPNKDKFLLSPTADNGKPVWVDPSHPAASEVRLTDFTGTYGTVNDDNPYADNLLFTGDSIDVLRILAEHPEYAREYRGKVKLCYIDPPFNTGQTFAQYDDWMEHSTWLSFMRDRLVLIRDLLAPDGSIWVHLDDAEVHRMRCLLDEVFGAGAFAATIAWEKSYAPKNNTFGFSSDQDYILVYGRSPSFQPNRMPRTAEMDGRYDAPDGDPVPWKAENATAGGPGVKPGFVYGIQSPFTGEVLYPPPGRWWSLGHERMRAGLEGWAPYELRLIDDREVRSRVSGVPLSDLGEVSALMLANEVEVAQATASDRLRAGNWPEVYFTKGGSGRLARKARVPERGVVPRTLWRQDEVGHSQTGKREVQGLFPGVTPFATPKPEAMLDRVIHVGSNHGDVVLDVFGGSGATAAVAHKMGRRWVTAEINPETVASFVRPRLEMVVDGEQGGISKQAEWAGGAGFRSVKVAGSMYEVTEFGVLLADWATNGRFARAVAGQLGFEFEADAAPLCGRRGRMRLAVLDGAVGVEEVRHVVAALGEGERVVIVGKAVLPGAEELLVELSRGSRVRVAPDDLVSASAKRARKRAEAAAAALLADAEAPEAVAA